MNSIIKARVAVFGVGGVGSYVLEALARCGVGTLWLVDGDTVGESNLNRQLIATMDTLGMKKTEAAKERVLSINPDAKVYTWDRFYRPENADEFPFEECDYVVDAIDMVTSKLLIIEHCRALGIPVISSMGTGNKLHAELFRIADIYDTNVCPLARVIRRECRKRGIDRLKVLYSEEEPTEKGGRDGLVGSVSFVPSVAGLLIAGEVIRDLTGK